MLGNIFLKILGGIDLLSSALLLSLVFGINPFNSLIVFSASLLLVKSMFLLTGELLSFIDLFGSLILLLSILFSIPVIILWILSLLLMAKAFASFV